MSQMTEREAFNRGVDALLAAITADVNDRIKNDWNGNGVISAIMRDFLSSQRGDIARMAQGLRK